MWSVRLRRLLDDPSLLLYSLEGREGLRARQLAHLLNVSHGDVEAELEEARGNKMLRGVLAEYSRLNLHTFLGVNEFAGEALYCMVKTLKPDIVVETGVSAGVSSSFILQGLHSVGRGRLHSIDLPGEVESGLLIPHDLRDRWELARGTSREFLPSLLDRLQTVDIFFHDSEHTPENMRFEFETAWPHIRKGGLLVTDDSASNSSFREFLGRRHLKSIDLFAHSMAGVKKT